MEDKFSFAKANMSNLTIAFDPGASLSKVFFSINDSKPELLLMEPYTVEMSKESFLAHEENILGISSPEDSAWVEYGKQFWGVGSICKKFYADLMLEQPKFESAVYKTLAVVGAIAQKKSLPNGTPICLGILLPYGEYSDRDSLSNLIVKALSDFSFRGKQRSFTVDNFVCRPEGFGLFAKGRSSEKSLRERKVAVVMIGYRNTSVFVVDKGTLAKGASEDLGFHKLIESVQQRIAGQKPLVLTSAICEAGSKIILKALFPLVRVKDPSLQSAELARIKSAVEVSREEYWLLLSNYLSHQVPSDIDEIIFAGGTSQYFRNELSKLFRRPERVYCDTLEYLVEKSFLFSMPKSNLGFRLTDNYGFFSYLSTSTKKI